MKDYKKLLLELYKVDFYTDKDYYSLVDIQYDLTEISDNEISYVVSELSENRYANTYKGDQGRYYLSITDKGKEKAKDLRLQKFKKTISN